MASDLIQEQVYSDPVAIFGTDYAELQSFFQNSFPPQHLSAQSWGLQETLTDLQKDNLYNSMLAAVGMTDQDIFYSYTLALSSSKDLVTVQKMGLSDSTFVCDRRKGFSQINTATKYRAAEHKLTALSRRLRDSFGHARIGAYGDYVLFEDKKNSITGRIILKKDDLKTWKGVIEQYIADNGISIT